MAEKAFKDMTMMEKAAYAWKKAKGDAASQAERAVGAGKEAAGAVKDALVMEPEDYKAIGQKAKSAAEKVAEAAERFKTKPEVAGGE